MKQNTKTNQLHTILSPEWKKQPTPYRKVQLFGGKRRKAAVMFSFKMDYADAHLNTVFRNPLLSILKSENFKSAVT